MYVVSFSKDKKRMLKAPGMAAVLSRPLPEDTGGRGAEEEEEGVAPPMPFSLRERSLGCRVCGGGRAGSPSAVGCLHLPGTGKTPLGGEDREKEASGGGDRAGGHWEQVGERWGFLGVPGPILATGSLRPLEPSLLTHSSKCPASAAQKSLGSVKWMVPC